MTRSYGRIYRHIAIALTQCKVNVNSWMQTVDDTVPLFMSEQLNSVLQMLL